MALLLPSLSEPRHSSPTLPQPHPADWWASQWPAGLCPFPGRLASPNTGFLLGWLLCRRAWLRNTCRKKEGGARWVSSRALILAKAVSLCDPSRPIPGLRVIRGRPDTGLGAPLPWDCGVGCSQAEPLLDLVYPHPIRRSGCFSLLENGRGATEAKMPTRWWGWRDTGCWAPALLRACVHDWAGAFGVWSRGGCCCPPWGIGGGQLQFQPQAWGRTGLFLPFPAASAWAGGETGEEPAAPH